MRLCSPGFRQDGVQDDLWCSAGRSLRSNICKQSQNINEFRFKSSTLFVLLSVVLKIEVEGILYKWDRFISGRIYSLVLKVYGVVKEQELPTAAAEIQRQSGQLGLLSFSPLAPLLCIS